MFDFKFKKYSDIYFKFKNKYEHSFTTEEKIIFQQMVLDKLKLNPLWVNAETLIIPETGNLAFVELAHMNGKKVITLHKASKENIKSHLHTQPMMKTEREKLFSSLDEMNRVKIAGIAGNQRKRFIQCLFEELNVDDIGQTIFFDDSIFSGYTFLAAQYRLKIYHMIILFYLIKLFSLN